MKQTHYIILASLMMLSACGGVAGVREQLGVEKGSPDEFAVVRRAPLEVPPPYAETTLPLPDPGAPRPQEDAPDEAARRALLGKTVQTEEPRRTTATLTTPTKSLAEQTFLDKARASDADPSVRERIDAETAELHDRNKPVAERLLSIGGDSRVPSATVVDAKAEAERIKANQEAGKSITDGETPSIEE